MATKSVFDVLIAVQNDIPVIAKKAGVKAKSGKVMYKHETIEGILEAAQPVFIKHKCGIYFTESECGNILYGHFIANGIDGDVTSPCRMGEGKTLVGGNDMQQKGSRITYARRYILRSLLNLACEDDDAQSVRKSAPINMAPVKKQNESLIKIAQLIKSGDVDKQFVQESMKSLFEISDSKKLNDEQTKFLYNFLINTTKGEDNSADKHSNEGRP